MAITAGVIGAVAALASAGVAVDSAQKSHLASEDVKKKAKVTQDAQAKLLKDAEDRAKNEESQATAQTAMDAAKKRQKIAAAGSQGRQGTILTGADTTTLGGSLGRKTLLGG